MGGGRFPRQALRQSFESSRPRGLSRRRLSRLTWGLKGRGSRIAEARGRRDEEGRDWYRERATTCKCSCLADRRLVSVCTVPHHPQQAVSRILMHPAKPYPAALAGTGGGNASLVLLLADSGGTLWGLEEVRWLAACGVVAALRKKKRRLISPSSVRVSLSGF